MKTIKTTHIDTGGHGYYSVSKKDITLLGIADKITSYSGHTFDRVYLEEDQDGTLLYETAKAQGINLVIKSGYNLKFNINYGYNPDLFAWKPETGQTVFVNTTEYVIQEITDKAIFVKNLFGRRYKIPTSNPFKFITKVIL